MNKTLLRYYDEIVIFPDFENIFTFTIERLKQIQGGKGQKLIIMNFCVIIPTYNNSKTLENVIDGVMEITKNIIVVNDGSTDNTSKILNKYTDIEILNHPKNLGKGAALKNAFLKAWEKKFEYAITIDSDGQHKPSEIHHFIEASLKNPASLIVGARNFNQKNLSQKSSFANRFSNFWFRFISGIKLPDTQSGYRLYPLNRLKKIKLYSGKYEFELELLVRAAWRNINIISIPIDAYYPPKNERVTHFRPFYDFLRISVLNSILFFVAIFYIKPKMFFIGIIKK